MTAQSNSALQAKRSAAKNASSETPRTKVLAGEALLCDMAKHRKQVSATKESARQFLIDLGVLTKSGKRKTLIRD
jgi:hypothetical protein